MTRVAYTFAMATALAVPALTASPAAAQSLASNPPVKIENNNSGTRKICFHKPKKITLFAIGCVTLKSGEHIFWNRKGIFTPFTVKVYEKRKLIDKYLFARDLPADTGKINIGFGGGLGFARFENIHKKFRIRACNNRFDKTIWLAFGFDLANGRYSEGWWSLKKGQCKTIAVTERLRNNWKVRPYNIPRIYYFARTYGKKPQFWTGGNNSRLFCINQNKQFTLDGKEIGSSCNTGHEPQPYRYFDTPDKSDAELLQLVF